MKSTTRRRIHAIDRSFYTSDAAVEFSEMRKHPWPGWDRVLKLLPDDSSEPSVLDVGCGNGRFAAYLAERWNRPIRYLGVDISGVLLDIARSRGLDSSHFEFDAIDFLSPRFSSFLAYRTFTLIVLFGVMHHVPGFEQRRDFLSALVQHLTDDGALAVTFWRFGAFSRFRRKIVPWHTYNQNAAEPIDPDDLEEGDFLMRWGKQKGFVRYCHFSNEQEIDALLESLNAPCIERFTSDGEDNSLNQYLLFHCR
jgi:tRNA (uracil-5-)-methyltransferase TRM9